MPSGLRGACVCLRVLACALWEDVIRWAALGVKALIWNDLFCSIFCVCLTLNSRSGVLIKGNGASEVQIRKDM